MRLAKHSNKSLLFVALVALTMTGIVPTPTLAEPQNYTWQDRETLEQLPPYIEIDYTATLNSLSARDRAESERLLDLLEVYEEADDRSDYDPATERKIFLIEERLYEIFANARIEVATINMLERLSTQDQEAVRQLWRKISRTEASLMDDYDKLDAILEKAD